MCETIDKIKTLTDQLTDAPDFRTFEINIKKGWKDYHVLNGLMRSQSVHNTDEVAIAKTNITKGSILEAHKHPDSVELILMIRGTIKLIVGNEIHFLKASDHIKIEKGINHIAYAVEDALFFAISIPKDYGFPE